MIVLSMPTPVQRLLRMRIKHHSRRPSAEELADSLSCERFFDSRQRWVYEATVAFRHLRQDARVRAARRALKERAS